VTGGDLVGQWQDLVSLVYSMVLGGGGTIYAGGYSTDSSGVAIPGYWKYDGTSWAWVGLTPLT